MKLDYIIVGAGLSGCVLASMLSTRKNKSILIVEKRDHIAGNCYDYRTENGVMVHKYGPHIFHTTHQNVWEYLSQFTDWIPYEHRVLAAINNILVPVPFNLTSIRKSFSEEKAESLINKLLTKYKPESKIPILELTKEDDIDLRMLSEYIYKNIFLGYTTKQWGMFPEELDPSVTSRIPVFISEDDRYFQDLYQVIPKEGYTEMMKNLIQKPNIEVLLDTNFVDIRDKFDCDYLFWTGMIDEYYAFKYGNLPYRSLEFKFETITDKVPFQSVAQVNYPISEDYTRITEFWHFEKNLNKPIPESTIIAKEYPFGYRPQTDDIPYYPIPTDKNIELYTKYRTINNKSNIVFLGRLADYSYYNMDQTVKRAMEIGLEVIK